MDGFRHFVRRTRQKKEQQRISHPDSRYRIAELCDGNCQRTYDVHGRPLRVMMSAEDLANLSYKELQALASRYKIPGNVKKQVLVKVLQAVRTGNNSEVTRLLTDVKKNRKKRMKRLKAIKQEDQMLKIMSHESNEHHSMHNNYLLFPISHQQQSQQYPCQWVGAEEEVNTYKYDNMKYNLTYNDIRQIVYYSSQNSYGNCDSNNNSPLLDEIMDLRTETTVSNYRSTLDTSRVNENGQQHQIALPALEDSTNPKTMLLKRMLQAPAGANLGAIASPAPSWPAETYPLRDQSADNSDTMTAKSDNEDDEIWHESGMTTTPTGLGCHFDSSQNYNGHFYRSADSFFRPSLDNGNSMTYEPQPHHHPPPPPPQQQHYQYDLNSQPDAQESCRSWLASNPIPLDVHMPTSVLDYEATSISRFGPHTPIQYYSQESDLLNSSTTTTTTTRVEPQIQHLENPYCFANDQMYNSQTTSPVINNLLEPSPPSEILPTLQFEDPPPPPPPPRYRPPHVDFYDSDYNSQQQQQPTPSTPVYQVDLENIGYDEYYQQQASVATTTLANQVDTLQQVQHAYPPPPAYGSGVLDTYWPRWSYSDLPTIASRTGGRNLENTLNLCPPNFVIYSKLSETCCVYSNKTPVMTLRKGENSTSTTHHQSSFSSVASSSSSSAEFRQHSFSSNCLLYNGGSDDSVDQTTPARIV